MKTAGGLTKLLVSIEDDKVITFKSMVCLVFSLIIVSLGDRRRLDIEYFTKLLEKIMEVQKNKKKLRSLSEKNSTKKQRKRIAKGNYFSV